MSTLHRLTLLRLVLPPFLYITIPCGFTSFLLSWANTTCSILWLLSLAFLQVWPNDLLTLRRCDGMEKAQQLIRICHQIIVQLSVLSSEVQVLWGFHRSQIATFPCCFSTIKYIIMTSRQLVSSVGFLYGDPTFINIVNKL